MAYYAYRYQTYDNGIPTTRVILTSSPRLAEIIALEGSCTAYAPGTCNRTTRVKPMNIMTIPSKYYNIQGSVQGASYRKFWQDLYKIQHILAMIPWTIKFSEVNLDDYPELFI